jgi:ATP-dependent helicase/nuclease subunit A
VVTPERVLVVDFKSDANPPRSRRRPPAYLTQLGLYALVANQLFPRQIGRSGDPLDSLESLLELPREAACRAAAGFTMR